ncbi:MAG: class I SAM-dependent methyltransferase [Proteobacteria bacterium]|nr:class I SAM-dependent methyltransferase [Pseudomonadota bacterium]MDA1326447.1 class I SAM-dependent methyltransferase [Pseudomonadota bacterium]
MGLDGDMVEAACYKGISARIIADYVDLKNSDKTFYIYDLFEHDDTMVHHSLPELGVGLFEQVKARFDDLPNVIVTKGFIPQILDEVAPEKIAFLHIDMNNAEAEIAALEYLWDRIVPGASIVLDDYGWLAYRAQKLAEDPFFAARGYQVLELPTGQGLVIK